MICDSWVIPLLILNHDSWTIQSIPFHTPGCLLTLYKKKWIMNPDSWVILPLMSVHNTWIVLLNPNYTLILYKLLVRSHESWLPIHPTSNIFGRGRAHYCPDQFLKVSLRLGRALGRQPVTSYRIRTLPPTPPYILSAGFAGWIIRSHISIRASRSKCHSYCNPWWWEHAFWGAWDSPNFWYCPT